MEFYVSNEFSLSKTYEPAAFEAEIYERWLASGAFHATPDAQDREDDKTYVVMMPLPNVTGALHMGHAMDNVMQDMLIRWHRMMGDNTLWMPGTDHAGIATQAVVEKRLKELEGKTRHDIGREGLVQRIFEWKDLYQARIVSQQQRMGCSCDWERQRFTMDAVCARAVRHTFFNMFADGLIVRGKRLVNWDPFLQTSISDDEVYHETIQGHFWHLRYPIIDPKPGEPTHVTVATTRPETMLGDTAVAVHPDPAGTLGRLLLEAEDELARADDKTRAAVEERVANLAARQAEVLPTLQTLRDMALDGRQVMLPLLERPIPLLLDDWAKPELGSGCVKITPAHDPNDYDVYKRHKGQDDEIDVVNILKPDGSLNDNAGGYAGLDRFQAREQVVADLEAKGLLPLIEDREVEIGHSDRSKTAIEPYLSDQWFVHMGDVEGGVVMGRDTDKAHMAPGLVQAAIDAVEDGRVSFHPPRFKKTYLDWLAEKRDWPISRQLWWGHRIPVWSREISPEELSSGALNTTLALLVMHDDEVLIRLQDTDEGRQLSLEDALSGDHAGESVSPLRMDVCLLSDAVMLVAPLEAAGFVQDPDVLDTWFSSAIWPHSTLGWPHPPTADTEGGASLDAQGDEPDPLAMYYPGSCLVTARDIITLWVARMVLTGLYNLGEIPFSDVFIHANILDGKGERMSKSKGNGIDPVDIIGEYGTDSMRYVLCDMQTGNQDIRLPVTAICPRCEVHVDLAKATHGQSIFTYMCAGCSEEFDVLGSMPEIPQARLISERFVDGRKFSNKLWNTARFALGSLNEVPTGPVALADLALEDRWILAELNEATRRVTLALEQYNPSAALGAAREFMWGSLCDWYLELIKPRVHDSEGPGEAGGAVAKQVLAYALDTTLRLLHPFIPFVTEHLFQKLAEQVPSRGIPGLTPVRDETLLIKAAWPAADAALDDPTLLERFELFRGLVSGVREVKATNDIQLRTPKDVTIRPHAEHEAFFVEASSIFKTASSSGLITISASAEQPARSGALTFKNVQAFVHDVIDEEKERARLEKELQKLEREVMAGTKKLGNENFVARAPAAVVAEQRARLAAYQEQLTATREALARL